MDKFRVGSADYWRPLNHPEGWQQHYLTVGSQLVSNSIAAKKDFLVGNYSSSAHPNPGQLAKSDFPQTNFTCSSTEVHKTNLSNYVWRKYKYW